MPRPPFMPWRDFWAARVETAHLVDAGGKLPVIIIFVDTDEHVSRVLPTLKEMAAHRLIVRENVVLEQGNLRLTMLLFPPAAHLSIFWPSPRTATTLSRPAAARLLKMAQRGHRTGILDLTRGEMGTRGTAEDRAREADEAAQDSASVAGGRRSTFPTDGWKTPGRIG